MQVYVPAVSKKSMYTNRLGRNAAVNLQSQYYKGVKRTKTKIKYKRNKRNKRQNTKVNCIEIDPKKQYKIYEIMLRIEAEVFQENLIIFIYIF